MSGATVDVDSTTDGTLVVRPHGILAAEDAVELRRTLVRAVRRIRPLRLILDLHDVQDLDGINLGTLVAACQLGDDHQVAVFLDHCSPAIAERLTAAGVPSHRLRRTGFPTRGPAPGRELQLPAGRGAITQLDLPDSAPPLKADTQNS